MNKDLKVGDKVRVMDKGLLMLQQFAPHGSKPNNEGTIYRLLRNGYVEVEFPIGDDGPDEHSQVAPYHRSICQKID